MKRKTTVLLDNNVIDELCTGAKVPELKYAITVRSNIDNPDYSVKYPDLEVIPSVARFGHSMWGGGEVWGSEKTTKLSNELLALGANQRSISNISKQTNKNQRDDADIITAAYVNNCKFLVSNDKKFILKRNVRDLMEKYNVVILSSSEFKEKFKLN